ncbi:transcriptional regulator [Pseudomonas viridiflava]|uniref:transcriptional regulator n=1 Tax=Pseudomonas viridiflava TaxID=33069 RepID=UPI00311A9A78
MLAESQRCALGENTAGECIGSVIHGLKGKTSVIAHQITCVCLFYNLSYHFRHDSLRHADMPAKERPVETVVRLAGGQAKLARLCSTSQPRIWQCINRNQKVPADLVIPFEKAVDGRVTRHELRPDLYPVEEQSTAQASA